MYHIAELIQLILLLKNDENTHRFSSNHVALKSKRAKLFSTQNIQNRKANNAHYTQRRDLRKLFGQQCRFFFFFLALAFFLNVNKTY